MKKLLLMMLMIVMMLSFTACGGDTSGGSGTSGDTAVGSVEPAKDGEIIMSTDQIAVVVNEKSVLMPYNISELEAAGVPVTEGLGDTELTSGSSFAPNLYLDENEDHLLSPNYYNEGDATIKLSEAEAQSISMVSYASEPADQGVSILGVTFGMTKSDAKALLGEPMSDDGSYCYWQIAVSDADYVGNLYIYFTSDADDAGASEVRLDFMQW